MDFNFTEEHDSLRDAVRRYIDKSYTFQQRQAFVKVGGFDRKAYSALAELGLTGLSISEAYGGMGNASSEFFHHDHALHRAHTHATICL